MSKRDEAKEIIRATAAERGWAVPPITAGLIYEALLALLADPSDRMVEDVSYILDEMVSYVGEHGAGAIDTKHLAKAAICAAMQAAGD